MSRKCFYKRNFYKSSEVRHQNKKLIVKINDIISEMKVVECREPQGTVIVSILFGVYLSGIFGVIISYAMKNRNIGYPLGESSHAHFVLI